MLNIVLVQPEIPMNTGNIARSCAASGARLHLVGPLGFDVSDSAVKRAGLDYWHLVEVAVYDSLGDFWRVNADAWHGGSNLFFATTKAPRGYAAAAYKEGDWLFFGRETKGLPEPLLAANYESCVRIPIRPEARSLNLSNAVAIVLFEALRQLDFPNLRETGALSHSPS